MSPYAEDTPVTPEQSRSEIERTLARFGADQFGYMQKEGAVAILFRARGRAIRIVVKLPPASEFRHYPPRKGQRNPRERTDQSRRQAHEKEIRRRWRSLLLLVKAKLEAVESGITLFEQEFLAHIVLAGGTTVGEWAIPQLKQLAATDAADLPALGGGGPAKMKEAAAGRTVDAEIEVDRP